MNEDKCEERTIDGRRCLLSKGHKRLHHHEGIFGENCTCMLRWYPNRCTAHPENNQ